MTTGEASGFEMTIEVCTELDEVGDDSDIVGDELVNSVTIFGIVGDTVVETPFELLLSGKTDSDDDKEADGMMLDIDGVKLADAMIEFETKGSFELVALDEATGELGNTEEMLADPVALIELLGRSESCSIGV